MWLWIVDHTFLKIGRNLFTYLRVNVFTLLYRSFCTCPSLYIDEIDLNFLLMLNAFGIYHIIHMWWCFQGCLVVSFTLNIDFLCLVYVFIYSFWQKSCTWIISCQMWICDTLFFKYITFDITCCNCISC